MNVIWNIKKIAKAIFISVEFIYLIIMIRACQENCVNGYVRISRLEPVCQIVWQTDLPLKPNF